MLALIIFFFCGDAVLVWLCKRLSFCLQEIAISGETCYATGVDSWEPGRIWGVEE
jgi:hypothetical protein